MSLAKEAVASIRTLRRYFQATEKLSPEAALKKAREVQKKGITTKSGRTDRRATRLLANKFDPSIPPLKDELYYVARNWEKKLPKAVARLEKKYVGKPNKEVQRRFETHLRELRRKRARAETEPISRRALSGRHGDATTVRFSPASGASNTVARARAKGGEPLAAFHGSKITPVYGRRAWISGYPEVARFYSGGSGRVDVMDPKKIKNPVTDWRKHMGGSGEEGDHMITSRSRVGRRKYYERIVPREEAERAVTHTLKKIPHSRDFQLVRGKKETLPSWTGRIS